MPVMTYTMDWPTVMTIPNTARQNSSSPSHDNQQARWPPALTLLGTIEQGPILWSVSNLKDLGSSQQLERWALNRVVPLGTNLHDEGGGDNGTDAKFHQST